MAENEVVCSCCGYEAQGMSCEARKIWEFEDDKVTVFHCGEHKRRTIKFLRGGLGKYQKKIRALKKYGEKISCTNKQIKKISSKLFRSLL